MFSFFRVLPNGAMYHVGIRARCATGSTKTGLRKNAGVKIAREQFVAAENRFTEKTIFKQMKN